MVTIVDVDNRPPWFKPCTEHVVGGAVICQSTGYTGRVVLNEQEVRLLFCGNILSGKYFINEQPVSELPD